MNPETNPENNPENNPETNPKAAQGASTEDPGAAPQDGPRPTDVIPRYRFNAVRAREQQLAQELEELKKKLEEQPIQAQAQAVANTPPTSEVDIKALSEQHAEAILEGDSTKAAEIQGQIIQAAIVAARAGVETPDSSELIQQAVQQVELTRTAEELQNLYPQLDKDGDQFDSELNEKVFKFYEGLVLGGTPPATALAEAADTVMAAAGAKGTAAAQEYASTRGTTSKADAAASTTPALTPGVGSSGTATLPSTEDVASMSSEEWEALPESTRRKLMGIA